MLISDIQRKQWAVKQFVEDLFRPEKKQFIILDVTLRMQPLSKMTSNIDYSLLTIKIAIEE